jgi:hypothetical protein
VNDLRQEHVDNTFDPMCVNSDFVSNDISESELQDKKQYEQKFENDEEL